MATEVEMAHIAHPDRQGLWRRLLLAVLVAAVATACFAPFASAAGDPVERGSFHLRLSKAFRKHLDANRVVVMRRAFPISDGTIDPITGAGTVDLQGNLRFQRGREKVVFRKVSARLGPNGVLKGKLRGRSYKLFRLNGARANRKGFGAEVRGVRARFLRSAARKINRKLGLGSLHAGRAGSVTVSEQPETVEVTGGNLQLVPASTRTDGSGTLVSKMDEHCIDFVGGNQPIAPAVKNDVDVENPVYDFPVTGGTIGPDGIAGEVRSGGGIVLANTNGNIGECDTATPPYPVTLQQTGLAFNLLKNYVSSHVVIAGNIPTVGDRGVGIGANIDPTNGIVSADPENHTVTINGLVMRINGGSALYLNSTFLQPSTTYDPTAQFASGDLFGTVNLTVTTR
jgi:hypothetical protein